MQKPGSAALDRPASNLDHRSVVPVKPCSIRGRVVGLTSGVAFSPMLLLTGWETVRGIIDLQGTTGHIAGDW